MPLDDKIESINKYCTIAIAFCDLNSTVARRASSRPRGGQVFLPFENNVASQKKNGRGKKTGAKRSGKYPQPLNLERQERALWTVWTDKKVRARIERGGGQLDFRVRF